MTLKEIRKQKGISQAELAKSIGVSRSAVSMWEIGASQPDHDLLLKISQLLNVSIDTLLGNEVEEKKPSAEVIDEELDKNVLVIRGRDGRYIRKVLTDDEIKSFETLFKNLPDLPDDV